MSTGVDIGPFQNIVNVGWNDPFILITLVSYPDIYLGIPDVRIESVDPRTDPVIAAGFAEQAQDDLKHKYVSLIFHGARQIAADGHLGRLYVTGLSFFVNISKLAELSLELKREASSGPILNVRYGGVAEEFQFEEAKGITPITVIRWRWYKGAAMKDIDNFGRNTNMVINDLHEPRTVDDMLNAISIPGDVLQEEEVQLAVSPRSFYGIHYRFFWDFLRRNDRLSYPPLGAKPHLETTTF